MSRYPRYPYQSTTHNAHASTSHHQPIASHQLRNPWACDSLRGPDCRESQSTNSSSSSRTCRGAVGGPGPPMWLQRPPHNHHYVEQTLEDGPGLLLHGPAATIVQAKPPHHAPSSRTNSERPVTPASSPGAGSGAAVDGCGGHCTAFDNFCYYCLQVIFVAGILTGISLTIAGSVLRSQQRGGDLLVLVYIGCMIAMVCSLLLSVQCCVRRNVKRRKRALRAVRARRAPQDAIPLQELGGHASAPPVAQQLPHYQPLLARLVQQPPAPENQRLNSAMVGHTHYHHQPNHHYRHSNNTAADRLDVSCSGTPWWRRHEQLGPGMAESRH